MTSFSLGVSHPKGTQLLTEAPMAVKGIWAMEPNSNCMNGESKVLRKLDSSCAVHLGREPLSAPSPTLSRGFPLLNTVSLPWGPDDSWVAPQAQ